MRARAKVVLPAPRSPDSVTTSPGNKASATKAARRSVAVSFGSATAKLALSVLLATISPDLLGGRTLGGMVEGETANDGGAASRRRVERHTAAMQFHK